MDEQASTPGIGSRNTVADGAGEHGCQSPGTAVIWALISRLTQVFELAMANSTTPSSSRGSPRMSVPLLVRRGGGRGLPMMEVVTPHREDLDAAGGLPPLGGRTSPTKNSRPKSNSDREFRDLEGPSFVRTPWR